MVVLEHLVTLNLRYNLKPNLEVVFLQVLVQIVNVGFSVAKRLHLGQQTQIGCNDVDVERAAEPSEVTDRVK